jgi:hypothetical protein
VSTSFNPISAYLIHCEYEATESGKSKETRGAGNKWDTSASGFNLLGENKYRKKLLLDDSKEVSLEVNAQKTKYMLMSPHQTTGQNFFFK